MVDRDGAVVEADHGRTGRDVLQALHLVTCRRVRRNRHAKCSGETKYVYRQWSFLSWYGDEERPQTVRLRAVKRNESSGDEDEKQTHGEGGGGGELP